MDLLLISLVTFLVLTAVLLMFIIMIQSPQDDSGGSIAAYKTDRMKILGAAEAPNLLEKITRFLATVLLALILTTSYVIKIRYDAKHRTVVTIEKVKDYVISDDEEDHT